MDNLLYKRLGRSYCAPCFEETQGLLYPIDTDWDGCRALGREVAYCARCSSLTVGEKNPPGMEKFFAQYPEELPEHERIT